MEELCRIIVVWRRDFHYYPVVLLLTILSHLIAFPSSASESTTIKGEAPDSIEGIIDHRDELAYDPKRKSLFPEFYHQLRKKRLDWWQMHHVDFTLTYDLLAQAYHDPDESVGGAAGELCLSGKWMILGERFNKPVYLDFRLRDRRAYSPSSP